jgi:hypothetical protein
VRHERREFAGRDERAATDAHDADPAIPDEPLHRASRHAEFRGDFGEGEQLDSGHTAPRSRIAWTGENVAGCGQFVPRLSIDGSG